MKEHKSTATGYFCPATMSGAHCYDEGDRLVINVNYNRTDAERWSTVIANAEGVEIAYWTLSYNLWLMVRPIGGDWIVCALRPWDQCFFDEVKDHLLIVVTDADDNSILAMAEYAIPSDFGTRFCADQNDIWYNACIDPGPLADDYAWVWEYVKSARLSKDVLLARAENHSFLRICEQ